MIRFFSLLTLILLFACQPTPPEQSAPPAQSAFEKIDFHAHYRYDRDFLTPLLEKWNMQALLVEVSKNDSTGIHRYWPELKAMQTAHPDRFFLCTGFNGYGIDDPDYAERIIQQLDQEISDGARLVKVWKNFGMVDKDASGQFIQIDDPRLQPIWDFLIEKNIPMLAHIGEPLQAWRPLEEGNPHAGYYRDHPEYHAYLHPEIPSWETIMQARDNWLARNPQLTVVGAHNGSMSHDVDEIARRLDKYPNFYVETAARFGDFTRQDSEKVRQFLLKYQDRFLYGTDLGTSEPASERSEESLQNQRDMFDKRFDLHWTYYSGVDSLIYDGSAYSYPIQTKSLALPDSVLRKIYWENARKILSQSRAL